MNNQDGRGYFSPPLSPPPPHGSSATAATVRSPSGRGAVPTSPSACWRTAPNGTAPHRDAAPRGGTGGLPRRPRPKRLRRKAPELCPAQPSPTPPGAASQSRLTALAPDPHPRVTALPHRPPHRLLRAVGSGPVRSGPALTHSLTMVQMEAILETVIRISIRPAPSSAQSQRRAGPGRAERG